MENKEWKKSEEREICLSDLLWKIAGSWRMMLVLMVIFAVAVTGYKYYGAKKAATNTTQTEVSVESLKEQLTDQEKQGLENVENLENMVSKLKKYQKESVLMNIDAYQKNVVTLQYYVDTNYTYNYTKDVTPDYSNALVNAYTAYIENKGILQPVCEKLGETEREQYIGELITAGSRVATNGNQIDAADTSERIFAIYVTGEDMDAADQLADAVADAITAYQPSLEEQIGSHTLSLIDRYESVVADSNLATQQSTLSDTITTLQTKIDTMVAAFTPLQTQIYGQDNGTVSADTTTQAAPVTVNKKYIVLGAFIGLFLGCCWIAAVYIFGRRIKSSEELQDAYGMRVFGEATLPEEKKRLFGGVDRWIDKLQHKEQWTLAEQKDMILANLITTCRKESIDQVFVTTSLHQSEQEKAVTEAVLEEVRKAGIAVTFGENVARNARSLEQMSGIGRVIVIEHVGETEYTSLEKELDLCVQQKAEVLGVIALV